MDAVRAHYTVALCSLKDLITASVNSSGLLKQNPGPSESTSMLTNRKSAQARLELLGSLWVLAGSESVILKSGARPSSFGA